MHELLIYLSRHSVYQGRWMTTLSRLQAKRCKLSKQLLTPLCLSGAHLRRLLLQKTLNGKLIKKHAVSAATALMKSELRRRKLCVQGGLKLDTAKTGGDRFRQILGSTCRIYTAQLLSLTWAPQLSHGIEADAGFLCDKSVVLSWGINDALCTRKRKMSFLRGHEFNSLIITVARWTLHLL
jgi:hypothetical protein